MMVSASSAWITFGVLMVIHILCFFEGRRHANGGGPGNAIGYLLLYPTITVLLYAIGISFLSLGMWPAVVYILWIVSAIAIGKVRL